MLRWLEQKEIKYCEFLHLIRTFRYTRDIWSSLSSSVENPGHRAHAARKALEYSSLLSNATERFQRCADKDLLAVDDIATLTHDGLATRLLESRRRFLASIYNLNV